MPHDDQAAVLLRKARDDERLLLSIVKGDEATEDQIGFFCQQAVEKAMKSVLSRRGAAFRFTHDLSELLDKLAKHQIDYPPELEASDVLTPFAAAMRYDYLPPHAAEEDKLNIPAAVNLVRIAIAWASKIVDPAD